MGRLTGRQQGRGASMNPTPKVIVFDVNETLSDMSPMAGRFADVGVPEHLAALWFASLLRDGFALTAAGAPERFSTIGEGMLRVLLADMPLGPPIGEAVDHVMAGFAGLQLHPDVPAGVTALRQAGLRLVTLTNGSTEVADGLLTAAGLRQEFERLLSVDQASAWKPALAAYEYGAQECSVELAEMLLVAVHPWDIDGASRAGMGTAWINRTGRPYPDYFTTPQITVAALSDLAAALG